MPRRPRPREYDEIYGNDPSQYYRRPAREQPPPPPPPPLPIDDDPPIPYRAPSPPMIDKFERMRMREHPRREREEIDLSPRSTDKKYPGQFPESEIEGDLVPVGRRRSLPPRELLRDHAKSHEFIRRSRSQKKGEKLKRLELERGDRRPSSSGGRREEYIRERSSRHPRPPSRLRPASGYQTELEDDEDDDIVIPGKGGRGGSEKEEIEELSIRGDEESSPESEDSATLARVPPRPRDSGMRQRHGRRGYEMLRPPRVPSPEVSFEEQRLHRREMRGMPPREETIPEERMKNGPPMPVPIPMHRVPPEHLGPRKGEFPVVDHRLLEATKAIPSDASEDDSDSGEENGMFKSFYQHHDPEPSRPISPRKDAIDGWAIVNAGPKPMHTLREPDPFPEPRFARDSRQKVALEDKSAPGTEVDGGRGKIGRRYVGLKDKKNDLWTEITKDLVVKEAIERIGYEYEETASSYYIFSYLQYDDVSALVEMSEDIRQARRRRIQEIHQERASMAEKPSQPILDKPPSPSPSPRFRPREERRVRERIDESRRPGRSGRK
ncbi:hypothetical protein P168DRAFT_110063 [Aspergillus campestris IBT 28561]|uniref:DUF8035 domain-containing protein n=1 Tax=Aspergillus campestris (strain IBT 28561) TaxID=1392248 RepID=A0A2I1D8Z2_ASPC2|nr:uncharacterized protein P168DRAFT_110063 [Aspergillus campestris IBT 28561]PKY06343.1 hypothetical protein P168DRAFT_110063 [Aspergillus campestris IBT 28561]